MKRIRIIIADGHEVIRYRLHTFLTTQPNWEVVGEAQNGFDAVWLAVNHTPDLAILDLSLSGLNGLEVASLIRETNADIKILLLSMPDLNELEEEGIAAGVTKVLSKASAGRVLVETIQEICEGTLSEVLVPVDTPLPALKTGLPDSRFVRLGQTNPFFSNPLQP
ncbi:MAG: response regulator transcription factor [Blastocatellia bacterium]|nr:response regulator transcription factor [Blastocatellia bacterium]